VFGIRLPLAAIANCKNSSYFLAKPAQERCYRGRNIEFRAPVGMLIPAAFSPVARLSQADVSRSCPSVRFINTGLPNMGVFC
jgi:hypothetical protein